MISFFRRKSPIIQAVQLRPDNLDEVSAFIGITLVAESDERGWVRTEQEGAKESVWPFGMWFCKDAFETRYRWFARSRDNFEAEFEPAGEDSASAFEAAQSLSTVALETLEVVHGCLLSSEWDREEAEKGGKVWNTTPSYSNHSLNAAVAMGLVAFTGANHHWRILTPAGVALREALLLHQRERQKAKEEAKQAKLFESRVQAMGVDESVEPAANAKT